MVKTSLKVGDSDAHVLNLGLPVSLWESESERILTAVVAAAALLAVGVRTGHVTLGRNIGSRHIEVDEACTDDEDYGQKLSAAEDTSTGIAESSRNAMLAVLVLVFIGNQACRALPFYLVDFGQDATADTAMNVALDFGPGKYGLYATLGFTVPFTLASLAAGVAADSGDRMRLSGFAGLAWSVCTAGMALAFSFEVLLAQRALLGLAQAATNPAAFSLIAELFPQTRATASAIFGLGIYIGGGISSLGAALDQAYGWRCSCFAFGVASAATSLLAFCARDPRCNQQRRHHTESDKQKQQHRFQDTKLCTLSISGGISFANDIRKFACNYVRDVGSRVTEATQPAPARWLFLASALRFCAGFGIMVWLPAAMKTLFPADVERFAVCNSLIKALAGGASSLAGGVISDALKARGLGDGAGAAFSAASSLAAAPVWYMVLKPGLTFDAAMAILLVEYLVAESWLGPAVATLQSSVPAERRGAAQGVFSSLTALGNLLPAALGYLANDNLAAGLQASVAACYVLSAVCFAGAAVSLSALASP